MLETLKCKAKRKDWEKLPKEDWWVVGTPVKIDTLEDGWIMFVEDYHNLVHSPYHESVNKHEIKALGIMIDTETICQNTGMRDYKGVQIYEYDKCVVTRPGVLAFGSIKYGKGGFYFVEDNTGSILRLWDLEVNNYRIEVEGNSFD